MFGFGHHGQNPPAQPPPGDHDSAAHQPTFKIYCKADESYCLTVRVGKVVLAPANPRDEHQHWYKDMRHSNFIKDEEGYPAFALVNKSTGEAIKHSHGKGHEVKLVQYNPSYQDESVLWTESRDVGHGFRCIRMVNNTRLNFDAYHGYRDPSGVRDGTNIVLWKWCEGGKVRSWFRRRLLSCGGTASGDTQLWKIVPWCKCVGPNRPLVLSVN